MPQILRRAAYQALPWKNGGGVTHEAVRVPAGGDRFHWRISVAQIGASGPFSDFSGYRRTLVLLNGAGLRLRFGDGTETSLRVAGDLVQFDGALAAACELFDGACMDLNLMVSNLRPPPQVQVRRLAAPLPLTAAWPETIALFCIEGMVALSAETAVASADDRLYAGDLAVISPGEVVTCRVAGAAAPLVFWATLCG